ncbi:hypothetical protein GA0115240_115017 [Streptomyces sp. DvalAA-14]|uniref:hypothetical protein n=1 Tax=unclassified Streptomyces TaxID=2593676 RepID=UPI00081B1777|nr:MULTISPECIES: hypothetical protein [unclassified Streptomyces]MYS19959.1 hypothetical protein [Streptomyces sp. SID4948]SCD57401.1 hypothetical protein GA0115240_115017 [Streptomyces sp. DvalAA-14]
MKRAPRIAAFTAAAALTLVLTPSAAQAVTAPASMSPQHGACGWTPANNSGASGFVLQSSNVLNDRWLGCPAVTNVGAQDSVPVRCVHSGDTVAGNSNWYYIAGRGNIIGWIPAAYVSVDSGWTVATC